MTRKNGSNPLLNADFWWPNTKIVYVLIAVQEILEAEMKEALGATGAPEGRGYRRGYFPRKLITRVGTLNCG